MSVPIHAEREGCGSLAEFVDWVVTAYELWARIPACWAEHAQVTHEMRMLWELREATEDAAAADPAQAPAGRANWHDHLGRSLARLGDGPNAMCAKARAHRVGQTWDDEDFLTRKAAQRVG